MKLLSWNTAKRLKKAPQQHDLIKQNNPDVVALQEIIPSTELEFKKLLKNKYPHIVSSFELAPDLTILKNKRINVVKSRIPLKVEPEEEAALQYILGYLDTLAYRKQTGDPTVQAEIEAVGKMMRTQ